MIVPVAVGLITGAVLLAVGFVFGRRSRKRQDDLQSLLPDDERDRMLEVLRGLESWTQQYSGDVSDYQDRLIEINQALTGQSKTAAASPAEVQRNRFMIALSEIIGSNRSLQEKLESAESQLESQTRQLQSYLSEARTDGLTGLANRRALDKRLDELFAGYRGGGPAFSVTLIDIDKFKTINDTHGHSGGDAVLRTLAKILQSELPGADLIARFGGEEFAVLMTSPLQVAASKMNEVRRAIAGTEIPAGGSTLTVTASFGVSQPLEDALVAPVLRRADEALYAAKNIGRNRVYYHDGDRPTLVGAPELAGQS